MRNLSSILAAALVLLTTTAMAGGNPADKAAPAAPTPAAPAKEKKAKAELKNAKGEKVGTATFTDTGAEVKIAIEVSNLTAGKHGFHIHAVGKCEGPDFKSAGGHFNPDEKKHGLDSPEGAHGGDLPNLTVGADGKGKVELTAHHVTLGDGKSSLLQPDGTALVIHAKEDDGKTDPAGNAGDRIACGIVTKS